MYHGAEMTVSVLPGLSNFPRIHKLYSDEFRNRYYQTHQHAPDFLYGILCESGEECDGLRQELEDLLEVGARLGMLDAQMAGRLGSGDPDGLYSVVAELEVAKFLDDRGFALTPTPVGSAGRMGDMQVDVEPPIFVEVKAALARGDEEKERRVISGLIRYAEPVFDDFDDPVLVTFTVLVGGGFNHGHLERWLRRTLRVRAETGKWGTDGGYIYESHQGLRLAMRLTPASGLEQPAMIFMNVKDNPPIAEYLSSSIDGAYPQLPDDGRPSLVIVREFLSLWATDKHVMDALFGKRKWTPNFTARTFQESHSGDGLLSLGRRERLSAVGFLNVRRPGVGQKTTKLSVFHHPWARYPLEVANLTAADVRHLVPNVGERGMVWLNSDGDDESK